MTKPGEGSFPAFHFLDERWHVLGRANRDEHANDGFVRSLEFATIRIGEL